MNIKSQVLISCAAALLTSSEAIASPLWGQDFDSGAPGQSVTGAPIGWVHSYGDLKIDASPHPGWTGNAIVAGQSSQSPENQGFAQASVVLPSLPTSGTLAVTFDAWAHSTSSAGGFVYLSASSGELAGIQAWSNCCVNNVWLLYGRPAFTGKPTTFEYDSGSNFLRDTTAHVAIYLDYDAHQFWSNWQGASQSFITPKFTFVGNPQLSTLSVGTYLSTGRVDFDNFVVSSVPEVTSGQLLVVGMLGTFAAVARRRRR